MDGCAELVSSKDEKNRFCFFLSYVKCIYKIMAHFQLVWLTLYSIAVVSQTRCFLAAVLLTEPCGVCCITSSFLSVPGHQIFRLSKADVSHTDARVTLRPGFLMVLYMSDWVWNVNQQCFDA